MLNLLIFSIGVFVGILLSISICRTVEKGLKSRLDNMIHYIFSSQEHTRTKAMDDLMDTVKWEKYNITTDRGEEIKICGVFQNTTNIEIRTIILEFRFLDEDGIIIKTENYIEYGNTLPGEKRRLSMSVLNFEFDTFNVIARTNCFANIPHFK